MVGNIIKLFFAGVGIAVIVYTVNNWDYYVDHLLPTLVIVAAAIAVIWNLAAMRK
ncbi:hypothetical protein ES703_118582 [subsurface metagenome]